MKAAFEVLGERSTRVVIDAAALPPRDPGRRFRTYAVSDGAEEVLRQNVRALLEELGDVEDERTSRGGWPLSKVAGRAPMEVRVRITETRLGAIATVRRALAALPDYAERSVSSSLELNDLPGEEGPYSVLVALVQREAASTEVRLVAGARPGTREMVQQQLDRVAAQLEGQAAS